MARFMIVMTLTAIVTYAAILIMPWWVPMPLAFLLILLLPMRGGKAFMATALGAAISYVILTIRADIANDHILSTKMAVLFFHTPHFWLMIIFTSLIGFVTAGLGGWSGAMLRQLFRNKNI